MQMTVLIVALLAGSRVLTKEHHDEMPLKSKLHSESIKAINYKQEHHHQCFENVYNQTL